ncbi:MAG: pantetheine-phosphate adenylyltransferase [Candidatus Sericytochromatia bacterium]|nr:pantetheine-phosphate adenylyltransferase [Candidatus Tanganyikabacteria bacterium]
MTATSVRTAVYPGSFDPVTVGHIDVIDRAIELFDRVVVAVLHNTTKKGLLTVEERVTLLREVLADRPTVEVCSFQGLTADFAASLGARTLIRGLRAVSDFDAELRIALMNRRLNPELDTVFLMTRAENLFLASSTVKEVASLGGDITSFVPASVARHLAARFRPTPSDTESSL